MSRIKGSCLCGKVQYEASGEPVMIATCHCKHCQKAGGSSFSVNLGVPPDAVTLTGDSLKVYEDNGTDSGVPMLRKFCSDCGSPILSEVLAAGGLNFIKAGTLEDSSWVVPTAEIWCDSKVQWGTPPADTPQVPGNPPLG